MRSWNTVKGVTSIMTPIGNEDIWLDEQGREFLVASIEEALPA
jgi:hypothetical protein